MESVDPLGPDEDRAPICPACGVTMLLVDEGGEPRFACLECGFSDDPGVSPQA